MSYPLRAGESEKCACATEVSVSAEIITQALEAPSCALASAASAKKRPPWQYKYPSDGGSCLVRFFGRVLGRRNSCYDNRKPPCDAGKVSTNLIKRHPRS